MKCGDVGKRVFEYIRKGFMMFRKGKRGGFVTLDSQSVQIQALERKRKDVGVYLELLLG